MVLICRGGLSEGFVWMDEGLALLTEKEIFGTARPRRKVSRQKAADRFLALEDLTTGDLVVHSEQGIGRYEGLVKMELDGVANDFLQLCYRDDDRLYLPVDRMGMIQKYMGVEGILPVSGQTGGQILGTGPGKR